MTFSRTDDGRWVPDWETLDVVIMGSRFTGDTLTVRVRFYYDHSRRNYLDYQQAVTSKTLLQRQMFEEAMNEIRVIAKKNYEPFRILMVGERSE